MVHFITITLRYVRFHSRTFIKVWSFLSRIRLIIISSGCKVILGPIYRRTFIIVVNFDKSCFIVIPLYNNLLLLVWKFGHFRRFILEIRTYPLRTHEHCSPFTVLINRAFSRLRCASSSLTQEDRTFAPSFVYFFTSFSLTQEDWFFAPFFVNFFAPILAHFSFRSYQGSGINTLEAV